MTDADRKLSEEVFCALHPDQFHPPGYQGRMFYWRQNWREVPPHYSSPEMVKGMWEWLSTRGVEINTEWLIDAEQEDSRTWGVHLWHPDDCSPTAHATNPDSLRAFAEAFVAFIAAIGGEQT